MANPCDILYLSCFCRVTILRDDKHRSKGVAFVMYVEKDSAHQAVKALNNTKVGHFVCASFTTNRATFMIEHAHCFSYHCPFSDINGRINLTEIKLPFQ